MVTESGVGRNMMKCCPSKLFSLTMFYVRHCLLCYVQRGNLVTTLWVVDDDFNRSRALQQWVQLSNELLAVIKR